MKRAIEVAVLLAALSASAQAPEKAVRVPDAVTALKIAEPLLAGTYGKHQIDSEKPLSAKLIANIWLVTGDVMVQ
jgi:NTF2 fold immunity protein